MVRVVISPLAKHDIDSAAEWYENKSIGLGKRFLNEVKETVNFIKANPLACPLIYNDIRLSVVRIFPYTIHYYFNDNENIIFISGVFHTSLNPKKWKKRKP